jgi:ribosomal protein RSM22 (predicted rRNA methylase)
LQVPPELRELSARRAASFSFSALQHAAQTMSETYRERRATAEVRVTPEERVAAYLVTRAPATYAVARSVLQEIGGRLGTEVRSVLDVGAGVGTASLAAREVLTGVERVTCIESDPTLAAAGRELVPGVEWRIADLRRMDAIPEHDLVIASYALGELRNASVAMRLWAAARVVLVVIEPGTPAHWESVLELRARLLNAGAHMVAPCPGAEPCPLPPHDWCHFAVRVERSSLHRRLKAGALGYEDEKFSYLAVAKQPARTAEARIIRRPQHQPGLITIELCLGDRTETLRIPKSDRERFRVARQASWGGEWRK